MERIVLTESAIYGKVIYLGADRDPDDFYEITREEYEKQIDYNIKST